LTILLLTIYSNEVLGCFGGVAYGTLWVSSFRLIIHLFYELIQYKPIRG